MASIYLKGLLNSPISCTLSEAEKVEQKKQQDDGKAVMEVGGATFTISDVKYIIKEQVQDINNDTFELLQKDYYNNREKFINATIEEKVIGSWGQFALMGLMLTGENIKTDPNLDKIKKWYEPIAKKYYTDNPDKMHLSLRYIVDNFNKTYSIAPTKKIEDYKGTKDGVRFALLKIFELTEGLNH